MCKSTLMCQHCIWTSRRNHSFSLGLRCPLPTFELCSFLNKCSPFFLPGLPFQIEQDGGVLLGTLLCPVLEKIIAEGCGQPSRCCQSYSRKSETGPVHLHGTKSKAGETLCNGSRRSKWGGKCPLLGQAVHTGEAVHVSDEVGGSWKI